MKKGTSFGGDATTIFLKRGGFKKRAKEGCSLERRSAESGNGRVVELFRDGFFDIGRGGGVGGGALASRLKGKKFTRLRGRKNGRSARRCRRGQGEDLTAQTLSMIKKRGS